MPGYSPSPQIMAGQNFSFMHNRSNHGHGNVSLGMGHPGISQGMGFSFQKRNQRVDWRKLASVDVERIARDVDVAALQDNILNVAFCDVQSEVDVRNVDYNFVKLFMLAQLMVEYLLHSQEFLQNYINEIENKAQDIMQEQENLKAEVDKKTEAYKNLKKEFHKTKKMLAEYQMMMRAGASGAHKCPFCSKSFVTEEFLRRHIERRHSEKIPVSHKPSQPIVQAELPENEKNQLLEEIQKISTRLQLRESKLQSEEEERKQRAFQQRENELERIREMEREQIQWKESEEQRLKDEMDKFKDMIVQELKEVHSQKDAAEQALKDLQRQIRRKRSMTGDLEDVDGGPEKKIQVLKDDFSTQIQELKLSYQEELSKLDRKFKTREENLKAGYEAELDKSKSLLAQYESALNKERDVNGRGNIEMKSMAEKLRDLEKLVEEQKASQAEKDSVLTLSQLNKVPPTPPPRTSQTSTDALRSSGDHGGPEPDDTISLWVATINHQNYRVWRTSSTPQSDWKDVFAFCACTRPTGKYDVPVFVYSAAGSPYWRQYISGQASPPRSHYKQDFVFYASNTELLGTFRVTVMDSGSGSVVRSMMSKASYVEGWKDKGFSFYVMKAKTGQAVTKSVSFFSTLDETGSGDDVSVSSYTGTEEAKKNLAEVIKRSREDFIQAQKDELDEDDEELDSEEEDEEEEDLERDDPDGDQLGQSSSTSLWGSTMFETGTFRPFKNNPLATAQYNHSEETIKVYRNEAIESLELILSNYGVDPDATKMPLRQYQAKMKNHENRVKQLELEKENFGRDRNRVENALAELVQEKFDQGERSRQDSQVSRPGSSKRKSNFKSAITAIRTATRIGRSSETNQSKEMSQTMSSTGSYEELDEQQNRGGRAFKPSNRPSDEHVQKLQPQGVQRQRLIADEINEDPDLEDDVSVSEGSHWDSERLSEDDYSPSATAQLPRVTVAKSTPVNPESHIVKPRIPRGEKVRELTASLEASLNSRDSKKKLAGAVDLHQVDEAQAVQSRRRPGLAQSSPMRDDFDDGSDFSLSSLEDAGPQRNKVTGFRHDEESDEDAVEKELRHALRPTSGKSPIARTPISALSPKPLRGASKISIADDFDDDSDLELQQIP